MRCKEIMKVDVERVRGSEPVVEAAARMRDRDVGFLPVVDEKDVVVGTLTDRDIVVRVVADAGDLAGPVSLCMTREVIACFAGDDVEKARELMSLYQKSRVVVLDDRGMLAGVISLSDLARARDERTTGETVREVKSDTLEPKTP
jgi:CBS domain-containing protein